MKKVKLMINNRIVAAEEGTSILQAARGAGYDIPTLCYVEGVSAPGSCRVCLVEVERNGNKSLLASCVSLVEEGLKVYTESPRARHARKRVVELLLSEHNRVHQLPAEPQLRAAEPGGSPAPEKNPPGRGTHRTPCGR